MKRNTLGLFSGLVLTSVVLSAQEPPGAPPAPQNRAAQERGISRGPGPGQPGPRRENLTPEQRQKLEEAMGKLREAQAPLMEQLRSTRRELEQGAQSGALDEQALRAKAAELGKIEGELAVARAKYFQEMRAVLPAEAIEEAGRIPGQPPRFQQRLNSPVRRGQGDPGDTSAPERPGRRGPRPAPEKQ